jgi:hypothetical protein
VEVVLPQEVLGNDMAPSHGILVLAEEGGQPQRQILYVGVNPIVGLGLQRPPLELDSMVLAAAVAAGGSEGNQGNQGDKGNEGNQGDK